MNEDPLSSARGCLIALVLGTALWAILLYGIAQGVLAWLS